MLIGQFSISDLLFEERGCIGPKHRKCVIIKAWIAQVKTVNSFCYSLACS